jgi:protein TonB
MSDATIDRGFYFPSPMTDWYRERPFKVAFAVSLLIHAVLIAFIPGFRSVPIEPPRVLQVEITPNEPIPIPRVQEKPVIPPKIPEPRIERVPQPERLPEPVVRQPQPEPVVRQPQPEPPPVPRADIVRAPRAEPKPDFVVPKPELRPEPKAEPKLETRPEPRVEPPEPPPVARVEPRPEPRPQPAVEPRPEPKPEPRIEPRAEVKPEPRPDVRPVPRETPAPVVQPRVEPSVVAPTVARPVPLQQAAAPPPPVVVPQPKVVDESHERALTDRYRQIISAKIKQYEEYPPVAKRRHWEGTTVVQLRFTPEGKVADISVVEKSGHDILDEAAMKMIRNASPLPVPPEGLRTVLVPIKFRLDS